MHGGSPFLFLVGVRTCSSCCSKSFVSLMSVSIFSVIASTQIHFKTYVGNLARAAVVLSIGHLYA